MAFDPALASDPPSQASGVSSTNAGTAANDDARPQPTSEPKREASPNPKDAPKGAPAPTPPRHEAAHLKPQTGKLEPRFGRCVALAGKLAVVGSPNEADDGTASGSVHVFGDSKSGWRRVQRLTSTDPQAQDRFGQAVAGDSARIVIGRDCADESGRDTGGAVVMRRTGNHYVVEASLAPQQPDTAENFGGAVAIEGSTIVVGVPRDDAAGQDAGSAQVFTLASGSWTPTAALVAPDAASADWFGHDVAISGATIVVGAYGQDQRGEDAGAIYLWRRAGDGWKFESKLVPDDLGAEGWFGYSCAIDGNLLAVGAPRDGASGQSAGCVHLFRRADGKWTPEATIRPESGATSTWFGYAVAVHGGRLLVGVPGDATYGDSAGAALLFERQRGGWISLGTLLPSAPSAGAQFGAAVALSAELALVGRNWDEDAQQRSGSAWIFDLPTPVEQPSSPIAANTSTPRRRSDAVTITQRAPDVSRPRTNSDSRRRRIVF